MCNCRDNALKMGQVRWGMILVLLRQSSLDLDKSDTEHTCLNFSWIFFLPLPLPPWLSFFVYMFVCFSPHNMTPMVWAPWSLSGLKTAWNWWRCQTHCRHCFLTLGAQDPVFSPCTSASKHLDRVNLTALSRATITLLFSPFRQL